VFSWKISVANYEIFRGAKITHFVTIVICGGISELDNQIKKILIINYKSKR
jgi:hypothetical protein